MNASMDACLGAFGTGKGGFRPCRTRITIPKLLNMHLFRPFLRLCTVSENEVSFETMVSAVIVRTSVYRNLAIDMQNRARNDIRTRPRMASGDVHLAGPQSMPCFKSRNAVSTAFLDPYVVRASRGVIGRLVRNIKMPSRPFVIALTACFTAASLLAKASGKR